MGSLVALTAVNAYAQGPGNPQAAGGTAGPKTQVSAGVVSVTVDGRTDSTGYGNLPNESGGLVTTVNASTIPLPSTNSTQSSSGLMVHASRVVGSGDIRLKFSGSGGKVAGKDVGDASLVLTAGGGDDWSVPFVLRYTMGTSADVVGKKPFVMTVGAGVQGSAGHLFGYVGGGKYEDRIHGMRANLENGLGVEGQLNLGPLLEVAGFMHGNPLTTQVGDNLEVPGGRLSERALSGTIKVKRTGKTTVSVRVEYASQNRNLPGQQFADPRFDFISTFPAVYYGEAPIHYPGARVETYSDKTHSVGASVKIAW